MIYIRKELMGILLMFFCSILRGQDIQEDLKRIQQANVSLLKVEMVLDYHLYKGHSAKQLVETSTGMFKRDGNKYFMDFYGIITLQSDRYLLSINKTAKTILLNEAKPMAQEYLNFDLESFFSNNYHSKSINQGNGYRVITPQSISMEYDSLDIYFDKESFYVSKFIFYYHHAIDFGSNPNDPDLGKARLEITYSKLDTSPNFSKDTFSIKRFITFDGKQKAVLKQYQTYRFIDQT